MADWHKLRKQCHAVCFAAFVAVPFLNVVRFDIPRERFYFAGYELWINEFAIIFFALMFLMFLVVVSSVFFGRVYCGYLCPQMIFSEASLAVESRIRRAVTKRAGRLDPGQRERLTRALFYGVVGIASVVLAFVFMAYFVEPRDLLRRLAALDIHTAAGISGAAITILAFLDFTLVRLRFCTTVCPYGYLQGMLGDGNTLLVHYRDEQRTCIECKKCVRVCPMGIDIRRSPYQIECIHCAECIDACDEVLGRLKRPGLIHYTWGEKGEVATAKRVPWDARRTVVLLVLLAYAGGLFAALQMRRSILVHIAPDRAKLYRVGSDGRVYNRFRYTLANRGKKPAAVIFSVVELPGAVLTLPANPVPVQAGATAEGEFAISVPAARKPDLVSHFTIVAATLPDQSTENIPMTFLAPAISKGAAEAP